MAPNRKSKTLIPHQVDKEGMDEVDENDLLLAGNLPLQLSTIEKTSSFYALQGRELELGLPPVIAINASSRVLVCVCSLISVMVPTAIN